MKLPRWLFLHLAMGVAAASILFSGHSAWSQAVRTIKVVVAVPPASLAYTQANIFVEQISEAFGQAHGPMIEIATRTLADGTMGAEDVLHAAPDGNTVLMTSNVFIINPYVRAVHYDPLTSFEPVCHLARLPEVVVVSSTSHYRTLADLLSAARSAADVTMASFGPTGSSHIAVEMLKLAANVNMKYVPYPNQVAAVNALLGEHVTSAVITYVGVAQHLKDGKLRALATASRTRIEPLLESVLTAGSASIPEKAWPGRRALARRRNHAGGPFGNVPYRLRCFGLLGLGARVVRVALAARRSRRLRPTLHAGVGTTRSATAEKYSAERLN